MALAFPWGTQQTLSYGSISVTLAYSNLVFRPSGKDNLFAQVGCDRIRDPEYADSFPLNYMGASQKDGPPHRAPYLYSWQLQLLTYEQKERLEAISFLSQENNTPVRLVDRFYALAEPSPRFRAAAGAVPPAGAPSIPGMVYFWPIFDLLPLTITRVSRMPTGTCDDPEFLYQVDMNAREANPYAPVQGDIP